MTGLPTAEQLLLVTAGGMAPVIVARECLRVAELVGEFVLERRVTGDVNEEVDGGRTGRALVERLVRNDRRLYEATRLWPWIFSPLVERLKGDGYLRDGRWICAAQKLAIFLKICGHSALYSDVSEQFGHSKATISLVFREVLESLVHLYRSTVRLPEGTTCHEKVSEQNGKFKYFKDCIGALDGTHIDVHVKGTSTAWRNRKGRLTQNVLAVCDFDGNFTYLLAGWEGSAHDGRVLAAARSSDGFHAPEGRYYLGDAGYALAPDVLVPYRGVRYHLLEQYEAGSPPETAKELFNLRHSSLRNVIERTFGVMKRRWRILQSPREFSMKRQVMLVYALAALHNWINTFGAPEDLDERLPDPLEPREDDNLVNSVQEDDAEMSKTRDQLAEVMWKDYIQIRALRALHVTRREQLREESSTSPSPRMVIE